MSGVLYNPPGLSQISFRIGTWESFRRRMLELAPRVQPAGSTAPPLAGLPFESDGEWVTALIEAWAVVGDILTFYQERIANEGYLGTATQPFSISQLFQMIGYPYAKKLAATTHLAFQVRPGKGLNVPAAPGGSGSIVIPAGSTVRSLPGQARTAATVEHLITRLAAAGSAPVVLDQVIQGLAGVSAPPAPTPPPPPRPTPPQVYETTQEVSGTAELNSLQPAVAVVVRRQRVRADTTELRLAGTKTGLVAGEPLLLTGDPVPATAGATAVATIAAVAANRAQGYTLVTFTAPLGTRLTDAQPFAFGKRLALFGANAPDWTTESPATKRRYAPILGGPYRQVRTVSGEGFVADNAGLPPLDVNAFAASGGARFAATAGQGVYRRTGGIWQAASKGLSSSATVTALLAAGPPGQVFAGSLSGVFRTTDGGQTWEKLTGGPPQQAPGGTPSSPPEIVSTSLPSTVVRALAVWGAGLLAATDSGVFTYDGAAWSQASLAWGSPPDEPMGLPSYAFARLPEAYLVATSRGVFRSADGRSWSRDGEFPPGGLPVRSLAVDAGKKFAAGYDGVYVQDEIDGDWKRLTGVPGPVSALLASGGTLWAGTSSRGLWASTDLGLTWTEAALPPPAVQVLALADDDQGLLLVATPFDGFDATDWPGFAIQGNQIDLATTDSKITAGGWVVLSQGDDQRAYEITAAEPVFLQQFTLSATVTALTVTPQQGLEDFDLRTAQAWVESSPLALFSQAVELPTPVAGKRIVLAEQVTTPLGPGRSLIVTGKALNAALLPTGGVLQSHGSGWRQLGPLAVTVPALAVLDGHLFAATQGLGVLLVAGSMATPENAGLPSLDVTTLAAGRDALYAAVPRGGVLRWTASGAVWTSWGLSGLSIALLAVDGTGALYAATSTGTAWQNGAATPDGWQPLPSLPAPPFALVTDPDRDAPYAGTGNGVYVLSGSAWIALGTGLPNRAVSALLFGDDGALYAGTQGAGVYTYDPASGRWLAVGSAAPGTGVVQCLGWTDSGLVAGTAGGAGVYAWDGDGWAAYPAGVSNDVLALTTVDGALYAATGAASRVESKANLQTLEIAPRRLFVYQPSPGAVASLDQGNLPADLIEGFQDAKAPLSPAATVAPRRRGSLWIVQDEDDAVYYLLARSATAIEVTAAATVLRITGKPRKVPGTAARTWPLADPLGFAGTLDAPRREVLLLAARQSDPTTSETATLARQEPDPASTSPTVPSGAGRPTRLVLKQPLAGFYDAASVTIAANVATAASGQPVQETVGSGDAAIPHQSMPVKRAPVAHLAGDDGAAGPSPLAVTVNGLPWHEVPALQQAGPSDRVYITTFDANGFATLHFGDGVHGARLPTGRDNVVALYRGGGTGPEAEVDAGAIVQLLAPQGSAHRVTNPLPATRPSGIPPGKVQAPPAIQTLDRVVSIPDFANFLLSLPGVAQADVERLWTGAGRLAGITVLGSDGPSPSAEQMARWSAAVQAAAAPGSAFELAAPQAVYFAVGATLWVPSSVPAAAAQAVAAAAGKALAAAFGPARSRLGAPVEASAVTAVLSQVAGVSGVRLRALYRKGDEPALLPAIPARRTSWSRAQGDLVPAELLLADAKDGLDLTTEEAP